MFGFSKKRTSLEFRVGHSFADFKDSDLLNLHPNPSPIPQDFLVLVNQRLRCALSSLAWSSYPKVLFSMQGFQTPVGSTVVPSDANLFELEQVDNWDFLCSSTLWPKAVWHRMVLWMNEHLFLFTRMLQSSATLISYLLGLCEVYHDYYSSTPGRTSALEV